MKKIMKKKVYTVRLEIKADGGKLDYGTRQYEVELPDGSDENIEIVVNTALQGLEEQYA